jgi:hypothetical protein
MKRAVPRFLLAIAMLASLLLPTVPSRAAEELAPEVFVGRLYKLPDDASPFFEAKSRRALDLYFTKPLADLIWKDKQASKGEVGAIDGSPLYDAQDYEPKNLTVHPAKIKGDTATVLVTFTNYSESKKITFALARNEAGQWRIADIRWAPDRTLLGVLKDAYPQ